MTQKVDVILVVAFDSDAILPAFQTAADAGVKMISYDVLVEHPDALYVTFDNVGVGRLMAAEIQKAKPEGNYAFIKGDKGDPNATFLFQGITEVLKEAMDAGKIKNVCETFTDGWKPDNAQKNMEQCLTSVDNKVDAVVSENDGMAGGVVAALEAQGLAGTVPVSGQDGDQAALNRVALGTQTVSVWKDCARARQGCRRSRRRHRRRHRCRRPAGRHQVQRRPEGRRSQRHPARAEPDHQGQPRPTSSTAAGFARKRSAPAWRLARSRPATDRPTRLVKPRSFDTIMAASPSGWRGFLTMQERARTPQERPDERGGSRCRRW